jgi:hypothetical protein
MISSNMSEGSKLSGKNFETLLSLGFCIPLDLAISLFLPKIEPHLFNALLSPLGCSTP